MVILMEEFKEIILIIIGFMPAFTFIIGLLSVIIYQECEDKVEKYILISFAVILLVSVVIISYLLS